MKITIQLVIPLKHIAVKQDRISAPVRWFGGKGNMIAKLIKIVPQGGRPYVEPFCGSASLFFAREPADIEVLNDLNSDIVNFFRVMQNKSQFDELRHRLILTPYARDELQRAVDIFRNGTDDPVIRAWAFFVRHNMAINGSSVGSASSWSRSFRSKGGVADPVNTWLRKLSQLDAMRWRLQNTLIECRDAIDVINHWDNPDAVFYLDPPYVNRTRVSKNMYSHEMTDEQHRNLIATILQCQGAVVLSGYRHPDIHGVLEDNGWNRIDFKTACHATMRGRDSGIHGPGSATQNASRTESVWLNKQALDKLNVC